MFTRNEKNKKNLFILYNFTDSSFIFTYFLELEKFINHLPSILKSALLNAPSIRHSSWSTCIFGAKENLKKENNFSHNNHSISQVF